MITFDKCSTFKGSIKVPADKSITHRAIFVASMADGVSVINNPLLSRDTFATIEVMQQLGVNIVNERSRLLVHSDGYDNFKEPFGVLDCDNSGTTARLLMGVLAPHKFHACITGDGSLLRRPMGRVIKPLNSLGASIRGKKENTMLPASVMDGSLKNGNIEGEIPSAQVKSAVLLAGAQIKGDTSYTEPAQTRDHTERMFEAFGVKVKRDGKKITVSGGSKIEQTKVTIPGDFSSAAFFIGAGIIFEDSDILIEDCGLNPSRIGLLDVLKDLGVSVEYEIEDNGFEPKGYIKVKHGRIKGGKVCGEIISNIIDEIPVLAMTALFGLAPLEIRDAKELRVKECDRIEALVKNFRSLGAEVEEFDDGLKIHPLKSEPSKARLLAFDDHRISMVNIILAKKFGVKVMLDNIMSTDVSYPEFIGDLLSLEVK